MLIKEYHIPLPLSVEEYRIAQLYMIQKKSREESEGHDSAVEILENHPYTDGPNGSGQYTYKVYHIGRHLPSWFRGIAPKTALEVHEESWNAYPYTKTIFKVPFVEKFALEVETYFVQDDGSQENMFKLSPSELRTRELDVIDIVNDELADKDYKREEDPAHYSSSKTGRGHLKSDWISHPPSGVIMCAYKLIKVEFRYWGLQSKVERFVHDYGLRRVMLRAHRQAWAWQDEWVGLTIPDIRRLERETQFILQKKLGRLPADAVFKEEEQEENKDEPSITDDTATTSIDEITTIEENTEENDSTTNEKRLSQDSERSKDIGQRAHASFKSRRTSKIRRFRRQSDTSQRSFVRLGSQDKGGRGDHTPKTDPRLSSTREYESDEESMYSTRHEWAFDQIAMSEDSDSEFFDAREQISDEEAVSDDDESSAGGTKVESPRISTTHAPDEDTLPDRTIPFKRLELKTRLTASASSLPMTGMVKGQRLPQLGTTVKAKSLDYTGDDIGTPYVQDPGLVKPSSTVDILFLVFHGGSALDSRKDTISKDIDFQTLYDNFKNLLSVHFPSAVGRVALRMVPCVDVCYQALELLSQVHPTPVSQSTEQIRTHIDASLKDSSLSSFMETLRDYPAHLPVGAVPLLATNHYGYADKLAVVTTTANSVYNKFLHSKEGEHFSGQVCLLADCMGSLVTYDILTSHLSPHNSPSPDRPLHTSHSPHSSPSPDSREVSARPRPLSSSSLSSSTTSVNVTDETGSGFTVGSGFMFDVTHFFAFGSPLGLVLGSRRSKCKKDSHEPPPSPSCTAFYNLFYDVDPMASRVEPLLDPRFGHVTPVPLPPYHIYPTGMAKSNSLLETVVDHPHLFGGTQTLSPPQWAGPGLTKYPSSESLASNRIAGKEVFPTWRSQTDGDRIDYILESPQGSEGFNLLPQAAFSHIIHSRYWETKEVVSFMLRQVLRHDSVSLKQRANDKELIPFVPQERVHRWNRRTTNMKINRLSPNHRVSDVLSVDSGPPPSFTAKFQYGPLAMTSLSKEEVELHILVQMPTPRWELCGGAQTDKHGKLVLSLSEDKPHPAGVYPVKFLVKGDHTTASCNLFVVPPHTEGVVFSVDGALSSNFSLSAKDMRVKQGAVATARRWQERGYLLIYITGRPLIQKEHILSFLGAHRFPLGVVACADSLSPTDSQTFKTLYLARLIKEAKLIIHVAYGSQRHLAGFMELGLQSDQIYIHGNRRASKNPSVSNCQYLLDGFGSHLSTLDPRPASYDARNLIGDICFVLPGVPKSAEIKRRSSKKSNGDRETRHKNLSMSLETSKLLKSETTV